MRYLTVLLLVVVAGCSRSTFTNLGNGVAVPVESIETYAAEHDVTRGEARNQLRMKSDEDRVRKHAATYGITVEEAQRQIEHAASQEPAVDNG